MKKTNNLSNRSRLTSNSRRRQLLKRVNHKVNLRRQLFQNIEEHRTEATAS